jgi:BirA family transcriptional regulator, biotin operon repressor / biotin---[acetyl-CoA-carboxylase] ligase
VEWHERLGSTNDRLRELALAGAPPFTGVIALEQTAGRGRRGRTWISAPGAGLWMSVLIPAPPAGAPGAATLVTGLAAALAIEAVSGVPVGLKWPNDLFVQRRPGIPDIGKVGGVLCEMVSSEGGIRILAGVGINLRAPEHAGSAPPDSVPPDTAAFLEEAAGRPFATEFLADRVLRELKEVADPPPDRLEGALLRNWDARDLLKGRRVVPEFGPPGTVLGLDPDGSLRVSDERGRIERVAGGSVRVVGAGNGALQGNAGIPRLADDRS